jgi:hypothetical protein
VVELLEDYLMNYSGTVLLVSHDRAFINNVIPSTLVFEKERYNMLTRHVFQIMGLLLLVPVLVTGCNGGQTQPMTGAVSTGSISTPTPTELNSSLSDQTGQTKAETSLDNVFSASGQDEATNAQKAINFISKTCSIPAELLTVENEQTSIDWLTGKEIWLGIVYCHDKSSNYYKMIIDSEGNVMHSNDYNAKWRETYVEKYSTLAPDLYELMKTKKPDDKMPICIWMKSNDIEEAHKVAAKYPEAKLAGLSTTEETDMALYARIKEEINQAVNKACETCRKPMVELIKARGFEVNPLIDGVPMIFTEIPKSFILDISQREDVSTIYRADLKYEEQ